VFIGWILPGGAMALAGDEVSRTSIEVCMALMAVVLAGNICFRLAYSGHDYLSTRYPQAFLLIKILFIIVWLLNLFIAFILAIKISFWEQLII
jgi:hypothetical protein